MVSLYRIDAVQHEQKGDFLKGRTDETQHESDETLECAPTKLESSEMQCVFDCMKSTYRMAGSQPGAPSPLRPLSPHSVETPPC